MKKYSNDHGTVKLIVSDNVAIIDILERGISGNIAFDRYLLDMYAEDYIKEHFEISTENKKSDHKNIRLPEFLKDSTQIEIMNAIKSGKVILVSGMPGPTGKTTLVEMLREQGVTAFEKRECKELFLSGFTNERW